VIPVSCAVRYSSCIASIPAAFLLSTHADRQGVEIYRLLFVILFNCFFVCTVMDFSSKDKASSVKFCAVVHQCPGQGISHFRELCSPRNPKLG